MKPVITATTSDRIAIFLRLFICEFSINLLKLSFIFNGSIGRKSYLPIDRGHVPSRARVEKQKTYEVTKPQIISWRDSHHRSRLALIEFHRCIRAAGAIARDDNHGANAEACERRIGFAGRADRPLSRSTPGSDAGCFHLSTGDHPTSAVDGSKQEFERQSSWRTQWQSSRGTQAFRDW